MDAEKVVELCRLLGVLKHTKRTGWVRSGVSEPESVAGHMWRMGFLCLLLDGSEVDRDRCVRMALVHDVGEALIGDITPHCGVSGEEKERRERAAVGEIVGLAGSTVGAELLELWEEYEAGTTAEAKAVKALDKLDMLAQATEYENQEGRPGRLEEFFASTAPQTLTANSSTAQWYHALLHSRAKALHDATAESTQTNIQNSPAENTAAQ